MKSLFFLFAVFLVAALGFFSTTGRIAHRQTVESASKEMGERGAESDWFMVQRAFPANDVPRGSAQSIKNSMRQFAALSPRRALSANASDWHLAGPSNVGGRVTALLIHPLNDSIIYAGAASGGIWKTTDRGMNWTNIFNESFSIGALAFSPDNPNILYVGTGEANPSSVDTYPGNGLWRSTDAGATWTNLGLAELGQIGKIAVNPLNPNTIFVAGLGLYRSRTVDRGIYRSTNHGSTWTKVLFVNDTTGAGDVVIDPQDTTVVIASSWTYYRTLAYVFRGGPGSAIYRSLDGGTTWTKNVSGAPHDDPNIGRMSLAFAPSDPSIVYALAAGGGGLNWNGVYRSLDTGDTWFQTYNGSSQPESQVWYNNIIVVHPTNSNLVWAGMTNMYQSTNGGSTFSYASISGDYHVDHHAMAYSATDPNFIVLGNDGGIYTSDDGGSTWLKSYDLPITQYYAGTVSQLNPNHLLAGAQDNGSSMTHSGADPWTFFYGGDGFYCAIDPTDSNYVYAEYQYGGMGYSTNGGNSFSSGTSGINFSEFAGWETPIVVDARHPKSLYTGLERVYRSTNHMQTWSAISPVLTNHISAAYSTVSTIDVSSVDSSVVYAGTGDGNIWVTTNAGGTWTNISAGLPLRWVSRVVADPESVNVAYVTLSGFRQYDSVAHVFRTSNYGQTWTNIGASLPDVPVNDLIVDPAAPATLYIATDLNVMATTDLGGSWSLLGTALPEVTVHDLALNIPARRLVAFTHGRSVYTYDLGTPGTTTLSLALGARWNLVSVPLRTNDDSVKTLFPPSIGPGFSYDSTNGYTPTQVVAPGPGYWIQTGTSAPPPVSMSGLPITAETVAVAAGWNIIGSLSSPILVSSVIPLGTGITSNFFAYNGGYAIVDTIQPGAGQWVKVTQSGSLILQSGGAAQRTALSDAGELAKADRIEIVDAAGRRQTLYHCGPGEAGDLARFEMPPLPAQGAFDARFSDNRILVQEGTGSSGRFQFLIRGALYPLSVRIKANGSDLQLYADGRIVPALGDGSYRIPSHQQLELRSVKGGGLPAEYALSGNYPNPFNPTTAFVCSIPVQSYLVVRVYDALGRLVRTMFDGVSDAGERQFVWDASADDGHAVASGIYFCRMNVRALGEGGRAGSFVQKMLFIR